MDPDVVIAMRRCLALAAAVGVLLALRAPADDDPSGYQGGERAEGRVGRIFWAQPALSDTSVEFYKEPELRSRAPVYRKARFEVLELLATRPFPRPELVYRVMFDSGDQAYIGVKEFEEQLFDEPRANQVVTTTFDPPLGEGVHVYMFKRSGIFSADPDVIWERIRNDGPRAFRQVVPAEPLPDPKPPNAPR
jgi:hypothetical protein